MINITRPYWPDDTVRLCDPFGGSGTVYLEGQKHVGVDVRSSDLAASSKIIASDNVRIFSLSCDEIIKLKEELVEFSEQVEKGVGFFPETQTKQVGKEISEIYEAAKMLADENDGDCLNATEAQWEQVHKLNPKNLLSWRIRLYCCLRGLIRHKSSLARGVELANGAIAAETGILVNSLSGLIGIASTEDATSFTNRHLFSGEKSRIEPVYGKYSVGIKPAVPRGEEVDLLGGRSFVVDSVLKLPKNSFDVIVADPPYGFNTEESTKAMAVLFQGMIRALVESISSKGGQIVLEADRKRS